MEGEQLSKVVNPSGSSKSNSKSFDDIAPAAVFVRSPFGDPKQTLASMNRWAYGAGVRSPSSLPYPWRIIGWCNPFRLLRVFLH